MTQLLDLFLSHRRVTTDSRDCPEGSLFFALKGENFNGNKFGYEALKKGCAYAIVDQRPETLLEISPEEVSRYEAQLIIVDDVLDSLQQLAKDYRRTLQIPVIGLTGTNGKTTTKELIHAVLSQKYIACSTPHNFNNHIGVPLTLLSIRPEHEIAVIEMGANHPGEIRTLTHLVKPNAGLITNVGKAHLEGFGSLEGVIKTKGELYAFLTSREKTVFMNLNDDLLLNELGDYPFFSYGVDNDKADLTGRVTEAAPFVHFSWSYKGGPVHQVSTQFIGTYNAENMLAAIRIGLYYGVDADKIDEAIKNYKPSNFRSQFFQTAHNTLFVDAYNANPTSMELALNNFVDLPYENKVYVLGDMLELGAQTTMEHARIVAMLQKMKVKDVLLIGEAFSQPTSDFHQFNDVEEAYTFLQRHPFVDKTILVKGSNGIGLTKLLEVL